MKNSKTNKEDEYLLNPWYYRGQIVTSDTVKGWAGFVYMLTNEKTGQRYVGKKFTASIRKVKGQTRRKSQESDWKKYWSSSDILKEDVKQNGNGHIRREVICFGKTRGEVNFGEVMVQFLLGVLESDNFLNENIHSHWAKDYVKKYESVAEIRKFCVNK